jgi:hypothetical protein
MSLLWGVAHNLTHTMEVYGNYEREKRETEPRNKQIEQKN